MIERLLAEGKLVEVENESPVAQATYRYRGFVIVKWPPPIWDIYCIRPLEVGHIPNKLLDFVEFRRYERTHHFFVDGTETACLCAPCDLEKILADIDSWWAFKRGER